MGRQLTIFDWMPEKPPDINDISEAEAVQMVGDRLGVKFTYDSFFKDYRAKIGKIILRLSYGHFFPRNKQRRIVSRRGLYVRNIRRWFTLSRHRRRSELSQ